MKSAINKKELERVLPLYMEAKKMREKFVFDYEFRNLFINTCIDRGVIKKDEFDKEMKKNYESYMYDECDIYTPSFGLWVWENIWFMYFDEVNNFDLSYFKAIEALSKMEVK